MSSNVLSQIFSEEFEGKDLTTIIYKDQPVWILKEIGAVLDYASDSLGTLIKGKWADEFTNRDCFSLSGPDLDVLRSMFVPNPGSGTNPISSKTRSLLLLTESGLNLVLLRTEKPVGKKLRKFLATKVLPQIARTGQYAETKQFPSSGTETMSPLEQVQTGMGLLAHLTKKSVKEAYATKWLSELFGPVPVEKIPTLHQKLVKADRQFDKCETGYPDYPDYPNDLYDYDGE